jgi:[ribosomal protein S5]-alanine N-acetyltransferase
MELKKTTLQDLDSLFVFQTDEESNFLAAFTPEFPNDKEAYFGKWSKIIANPNINMQSIFIDDSIVGSIIKFQMGDDKEISYWLDRKFWGKGYCSKALSMFLESETDRPLNGRVAFDNLGSQRVLEKNGFVNKGHDRGYANARKAEILEYIYQLQ